MHRLSSSSHMHVQPRPSSCATTSACAASRAAASTRRSRRRRSAAGGAWTPRSNSVAGVFRFGSVGRPRCRSARTEKFWRPRCFGARCAPPCVAEACRCVCWCSGNLASADTPAAAEGVPGGGCGVPGNGAAPLPLAVSWWLCPVCGLRTCVCGRVMDATRRTCVRTSRHASVDSDWHASCIHSRIHSCMPACTHELTRPSIHRERARA